MWLKKMIEGSEMKENRIEWREWHINRARVFAGSCQQNETRNLARSEETPGRNEFPVMIGKTQKYKSLSIGLIKQSHTRSSLA
jgi:hypothetical protein